MAEVETVWGNLLVRDVEVGGVRAYIRSAKHYRWMTLPVPPGILRPGDAVDLAVAGPNPRVVSARMLSCRMAAPGDAVHRFEAVIEGELVGRRRA